MVKSLIHIPSEIKSLENKIAYAQATGERTDHLRSMLDEMKYHKRTRKTQYMPAF